MAKKKQFAPHIYPEWGELFANLTDKQNAEILKAITQFPNYEPENNPIWNFIKSQIEKDYEIFIDKCNKNESIIRNYWQKKKSNDNESIRTNTNEYECIPKRITNNEITNNELRITETETNNAQETLFLEQAKDKQTSIEFINSKDYKYIKDVYKQVYGISLARLTSEQLLVVKSWFEIVDNPQKIQLVLDYYKNQYVWDEDKKPAANWIFKSSTNFISVYDDMVKKNKSVFEILK